MEGKLYQILLTQVEMHDPNELVDITYHILYDSGARVAVDITAEVSQVPLFSKVTPYDVITEEGVGELEKYLSGEEKPVKDGHNSREIPVTIGFEVKELVGEEYNTVRKGMVGLRDAREALDDKVGELRQYCLKVDLVTEQLEREF